MGSVYQAKYKVEQERFQNFMQQKDQKYDTFKIVKNCQK